MQDFIITLLICSVTMSVLALIFMAITPLLEKRYSAKGRYYAWLIIVIGLIIPFRPHFDNPIVKLDMPSEAIMPIIQIGNGKPINIPMPVSEPILADNAAIPHAMPDISWWLIVTAIWLSGMVISLIYHAIKHYRFIKLTARWSEDITDEQVQASFQNLKTEISIRKQIKLKLCTSIGSPMMIGFVSPQILLPKTDFTQDELCLILKHELIHYKRKDLWYKCLVLVTTAIHWFNPIVHQMTRTINMLCELSCDDEVVRSMDIDIRQLYSETIIGVVRHQSKLITSLSTNFNVSKKGIKKRIFSIMDTKKKRTGFAIICAALTVTLGTGFAFAYAGVTKTLTTDAGYVENGKIVAFDSNNGKISFDKTNHIVSSLEEYNHTQFPLMAAISDQDIWLYGLKPKGVVLVKGDMAQYFDWDYLTPEGIFPQLSLADFEYDDKQEIGAILSIGSGTGVSVDELHIVAIDNPIVGKATLRDNVFGEEDYLKQLEELLKYTIDPNAKSITLHIRNEDISVPCELNAESIVLGNIVSFEMNGNDIKAIFAVGTIYKNMVSPQYEIGLLICDVAYNNGKFTLQNPILDTTNTIPYETQPSILYVNERLGFSIEFPGSWDGLFGVSENYVELNSWGAAGIIVYQKASHDTGTTKATGRLFSIARWIGTWTSENPPVMSGYSAVVLQTDKYTYMLHTPSGVEYNENDPAAVAEYKEMCESLDIIEASVKNVGTYSPILSTPTNSKYRTELDFLDSQEGKQICEDSYRAARAILEVNSDDLAMYLIDPSQTSNLLKNTSNVFGDLVWFVFKFNLDSIISEDEIRTSYEYALAGDDSYTYISMTFKKVNGEWKLSSIGKEK